MWRGAQVADATSEEAAKDVNSGDPIFYHKPDTAEPFHHSVLFDEANEAGDEESSPPRCPNHYPLLSSRTDVIAPTRSGLLRMLGWYQERAPELTGVDECSRRAECEHSEGEQTADAADPAKAPAIAGAEESLERRTGEPDLVGTLEKRSPWWIEGWRPRTYLLRNRKLLYFRKDSPDRPLGVLDFGLVRYELHCCWDAEEALMYKRRACDICDATSSEPWQTFYLKPVAFPSKVFAFRGHAEDVQALTARIAKLVAAPVVSTLLREHAIVSLKNFWRYPFLQEQDFLEQVESGDILLFRGRDGAAKLQRAATGALYDHVALLLRTVGNDVLILEATGTRGVEALPWEYFTLRRWHKCYAWIACRKVYFARTPAQLRALQAYVSSVLGRPYGLSLGKLVGRSQSAAFDEEGERTTPSISPNVSRKGQEEPHQSLFCSELVAACLKRCGVLAGSCASSRFWPSSFSQRSLEPLPLQEHAHVGEEQVVMFAN